MRLHFRRAGRSLTRAAGPRKGHILLEFALITLLLYLLLGATIDLGRGVCSAQVLQQAADIAARELSRTPLPADSTFTAALAHPLVLERVFDVRKLVINVEAADTATRDGLTVGEYLARLPAVNKQLRTLMIPELIGTKKHLRYPGTLLLDATAPSGYSVAIPVVTRDTNGVESLTWASVIEEIKPTNPTNPLDAEPFSITSPTYRGLVALRINYPYQAAAFSSYRQGTLGQEPNEATLDDNPQAGPGGETLVPPDRPYGPYAGPYSLGRQTTFAGKILRPFEKLQSAQAVFRREVYQ